MRYANHLPTPPCQLSHLFLILGKLQSKLPNGNYSPRRNVCTETKHFPIYVHSSAHTTLGERQSPSSKQMPHEPKYIQIPEPLYPTHFHHWFTGTKHLLSNPEGLGSLHGVEVVETIGKIYMAVLFCLKKSGWEIRRRGEKSLLPRSL